MRTLPLRLLTIARAASPAAVRADPVRIRRVPFRGGSGGYITRSRRLGIVAIGLVVVSARFAVADPIRVDQSVLEPVSNGGVTIGVRPNTGGCCDLVAQGFTGGVTAQLVAISVGIEATLVTPLRLAITPMLDNGLPDLSTLLAEVFVASGSASINDIVFLPRPFHQVAGQGYAIVASYPNAPAPPVPATGNGDWRRTDIDVYVGGELLSHRTDGVWIHQLGTDAVFATYVSQTPEPGTLLLWASGLGCVMVRRRFNRQGRPPSSSRVRRRSPGRLDR